MPSSAVSSSVGKGSTAVSAVSTKETLSASITPRDGDSHSDGLALIWNLTMPTRPEHIFTCGSPVTAGRFHPTEPTLVLGGCESGQLVIWDTRAGRLPVQKSSLASVVGASGRGHTHAICAMEMIEAGVSEVNGWHVGNGCTPSHMLPRLYFPFQLGMVTSSADGRVNFWSLANLREPVDSTQVGDSLSCLAVVPESEALLLGDEIGSLYTVQSSSQSSGQRSSRKQVRKLESTDADGQTSGHYGMVTSLSTKSLRKSASARAAALSKGFLRGSGGLVLSCGVDWTVKLWAPAYTETPLISWLSHSYDYMSDVKWCPTHPSVFATASSNGSLGLWNLAASFEEPITGQEGIRIETGSTSGGGLNKLKWSTDGRRMAVAAAARLHVLLLTDELIRPKGDEDTKLMNQLMARGLISRQ
jgi:dynein intermediate chain